MILDDVLSHIAKKAATAIMDKAEAQKALHRSDLEDAIGKAIREAYPYLTQSVGAVTPTPLPQVWTFTDLTHRDGLLSFASATAFHVKGSN